MDPQRRPGITKNCINSIIFSVGFPKNFDTLCCHLFSSSGVPRNSEMLLKHNACNAFRATPQNWKILEILLKMTSGRPPGRPQEAPESQKSVPGLPKNYTKKTSRKKLKKAPGYISANLRSARTCLSMGTGSAFQFEK